MDARAHERASAEPVRLVLSVPPRWRAPLLVLGFASLALGVAGGLVRLGASIPAPAGAVALHGALMVRLLGTVIGLTLGGLCICGPTRRRSPAGWAACACSPAIPWRDSS